MEKEIKIVNNHDGSITIDRDSYRNLLLLTNRFVSNNFVPKDIIEEGNLNIDYNLMNAIDVLIDKLSEVTMIINDIALFDTENFSNLINDVDSSIEINYESNDKGDSNNYA